MVAIPIAILGKNLDPSTKLKDARRVISCKFSSFVEQTTKRRRRARLYADEVVQPGRSSELPGELAGLELAIQQYAEANRAEFIKTKSRELTFGSVGFRLSTRVAIKNVGNTLQALKDFGLTACIRIKEECDKEAMKNLPLEQLHAVGATLKQEDAFGYEIKRELIQEVA